MPKPKSLKKFVDILSMEFSVANLPDTITAIDIGYIGGKECLVVTAKGITLHRAELELGNSIANCIERSVGMHYPTIILSDTYTGTPEQTIRVYPDPLLSS